MGAALKASSVATLICALVLTSCSSGDERAQTSTPPSLSAEKDGTRRPNVLLIVTDDQREGLSVMPSTRRLFIRGGLRFKNAFVTTPLCCPSRASILTGRYVHRHGVRRNQEGMRLRKSRIVSQRLNSHGYRTAYFGKFLNYWNLAKRPPGFDRWAITGNDTYYNGTWNVGGAMKTVPTYSTTFIRKHAVRFLRRSESKDGKPWLMTLATSAPHGPQTPEDKYAGAPVPGWTGNAATGDADFSDKPPYVRTRRDEFGDPTGVREAQFRTLMSVDDMIAKTFKVMDRLDESRRTLAIFVSDNGMLWGEFDMTGKTHAYTPSIEVPMMLRWPGRAPKGKTAHRLVTNVDIVPTILKAAGLKTRPTDGYSLLSRHRRKQLLLEYWHSEPFPTPRWGAIRTKRFQYVEYRNPGGGLQFREFFRLKNDPWQLHNLLKDGSRDNDPPVGRLSRRLERLSRCRGNDCP